MYFDPARAENRSWRIYKMIDPRDARIRYIGATHQTLPQRLQKHITCARNQRKGHCSSWLRQIDAEGLRPRIELLEEGTGLGWEEAEILHIAAHKSSGHDLTNLTDGGNGILGMRHSPESIKLMSENRKGLAVGRKHTPETVQKIRDWHTGRKRPEIGKILREHWISKSKIPLTEESLRQMYINEQQPLCEISKKAGVGANLLTKLCREYGIETTKGNSKCRKV